MRYERFVLLLGGLLLAGCSVSTAPPEIAQAGTQSTPPISTALPPSDPSPTADLIAKAATVVPATPTSMPPTASDPTPVPPIASDPTPVPATRGTITIDAPTTGAAISSPVAVRGSTDFWPFEATLVGQIKDAEGNLLGVGPITVQAPDIGQGGPFEAQIAFDPPATAQTGTLEVFEASAMDGSIVVIETVPVQLGGE